MAALFLSQILFFFKRIVTSSLSKHYGYPCSLASMCFHRYLDTFQYLDRFTDSYNEFCEINSVHATVLSQCPLKIQKTRSFLMYSGVIDRKRPVA